jgi:SAM-dependent methyltransferase
MRGVFRDGLLQRSITPIEAWELLGITRHYGGLGATRRMLRKAGIKPGMRVLELGCGSGYTASMLVKAHGAKVTAVDKSEILLAGAKDRARAEGTSGMTHFVLADAEHLPNSLRGFDAVVAESVLALCDPASVAREAFKALKPGGVFCDNELTYLRKPPEKLRLFLSTSLGARVSILSEDEWSSVFRNAGFSPVWASAHRISLSEDFKGILYVYGLRKVLSGFSILLNPRFLGTYLRPELLYKWSRLFSYAGYAIYIAKKPATKRRA